MAIEPGSEEERLLLSKWIKRGRDLIVGSSPLGESYFDTNVDEHHHFYFEGSGDLQDIPTEDLRLAELPEAPAGTRVARVDVIIRVQEDS